MRAMWSFRVKPVVSRSFEGSPVVIDRYISFFGETDVRDGVYKPLSISFVNKVLVFRGVRGSTVGSYVIYGLRKNGKSPLAMIVKELDPIIIAGCVLADIPLLQVINYGDLIGLISGRECSLKITYDGGESIYVKEI